MLAWASPQELIGAEAKRLRRDSVPRQKRIAIARVENGFDHIEGSESRFQRW